MDHQIGNLGAVFAPHAAAQRAAIIDLSDENAPVDVSYGALDDACDAVARSLIARGIGVGDRIGILGLNRHEFVTVMFGAMRAGIVPVPINIKLPPAGVEAVARDAGVKLMFCAGPERDLCPGGVPVVDFDDKGPDGYAAFVDSGPFEAHQPDETGVAFMVWKSVV